MNIEKYSKCFSKLPINAPSEVTRESRARSNLTLPEMYGSNNLKSSFINDGVKAWKKSPQSVKLCKSLVSAKKAVKSFVKTLPI